MIVPAALLMLAAALVSYPYQTELRISGEYIAESLGVLAIVLIGFQIVVLIREYRPPQPLEIQYQRYNADLGGISFQDSQAYRRGAEVMLRDRASIRRVRPNGDVTVFSPSVARFAVFDSEGQLRTFFSPWRPSDVGETFRAEDGRTSDDLWLGLQPHEADLVSSYLTSLAFRPNRTMPLTIDALLDEWKKVLNDVWRGYPHGEDDYTNDLVLRDIVEDVAELLDESS